MNAVIVPGKLQIPPLPRIYVDRPRLNRKWDEVAGKKLALVEAGAGFGKSTFLASNVPRGGRDVGWYTLDELDLDPGCFYAHLAEMIRQTGIPDVPGWDASPGASADRWMAALARAIACSGRRSIFVLDDVQRLSGSPEIVAFLDRWVRVLPEGNTMVLASREPLGLSTARLLARGQLAALNARDLLFTVQEVEDLFRLRLPGVSMDTRLSRRIAIETEGWAAGLEILIQSMAANPSLNIPDALGRMSSTGSGWFTYFAEEVVDGLAPSVQEFLYKSSIMPRLDAEICDQVLGHAESKKILDSLCRRNLFTFPAGGADGIYRYHHLFHEFLRGRLNRDCSESEVRRLRVRAAAAFGRTGSWAEAAALYAEGGDPAATLHVIERFGENLVSSGRYHTIRKAFDSIPPTLLAKRSLALSVLGRLQEIQGDWEDAEKTYRQALRACRPGERRSELLGLLAQIRLRHGDYDACNSLCRKAQKELVGARPGRSGAILCLLGLSAAERGDLSIAERHISEAYTIFKRRRDLVGQGRSQMLLATNVHYFRGNFLQARDLARQALVIFQRLGDQRRVSHSLGVLGFLSMAVAEEREARDLTEVALRIADELGIKMVQGYCHHTLGRCALLAGDHTSAGENLEQARQIGEELGEPALCTLPRIGLAELALLRGNRHLGIRLATEARERARQRKDRIQEALCSVLLGTASSDPPARRRRELWRGAEAVFRSTGANFELHRLLLLRLDEGEIRGPDFASRLRELLAGTARMGQDFLYLSIEPDRASRVLPQGLRLRIEPAYVAGLIVRLGQKAVPAVAPLLKDPEPEVRKDAVEVLVQIGGDEARRALSRAGDVKTQSGRAAREAADELGRSPGIPLLIRALGPLSLSIGDRELSTGTWGSTRALRLFQVLSVHRFRWVSKEQVMETLWPEADPGKAENNLRQSVHLLRKILEPDLMETRDTRYIRFRNDHYRLDPGRGYSYDVESFEGQLDQGFALLDRGNRGRAALRLKAALDLYRGAFMEESPYEEFVAGERERLRDCFLRGLGRLLGIYSSAGKWTDCIPLARRGLAEDPFNEDLHRILIEGHLSLRNRREALDAYHQYERMMRGELKLPPASRMQALAARIVAIHDPPGTLR